MDHRNREFAAETPFFTALVTPHRSLARTGFVVVMAATGTVCVAAGILFWSLGAWPVAGFFGLDFAAIWVALRMNDRAGRAYEEVLISCADVHIRQVSAAGRVREHHFDPHRIRLAVTRRADEGCVRVWLTGRGGELVLGAFLNPDDRDSFAGAVAEALAAARAGRPPVS